MMPAPARRFPWIVLAYLGPLAVVPLIATQVRKWPEDADLPWHAWQGLLLAVIEILVLGTLSLLAGYAALASVGAGMTLALVLWAAWLTAVAVHLAAIVAALADRRLELPLLARLASRLSAR